jgi:small subunit ribosomal protein S16
MLMIKLQRVGKKHQPGFRVVVAEKRSKLGGPPVEKLGFYSPVTKKFDIQKERLEYWLKTGAKATPTIHNLLIKNSIIPGKKLAIKIRKPKAEETGEKLAAANPPAAEPVPSDEQEKITTAGS